MRLRVSHTTRYVYPVPALESYNEARLMPMSDDDQTCLEYRLTTTPSSHVYSYALPTGMVHHFALRPPHRELNIVSESLVSMHSVDPLAGFQFVEEDAHFYDSDATRERYCEYLLPTQRVQLHEETDRIARVARKQDGVGTASFLVTLTRVLHRVLTFKPGVTNVDSTILHVLEHGSGVCQDFTHLMLAICRRQGIPARYVSGYLYTSLDRADAPRSGEATQNQGGSSRFENKDSDYSDEELLGGDAMHAWAECLMPDGTWKGFDPTNNLLTDYHYIKVHYGRDYGDVVPLKGIYRGPVARSLDVRVNVYQE